MNKQTNKQSDFAESLDLISRQAALECFHDWIDKHGDVHTADEMVEYQRIEALSSVELTPCDMCRYNPPSCMDGKPCTVCSAERRDDE